MSQNTTKNAEKKKKKYVPKHPQGPPEKCPENQLQRKKNENPIVVGNAIFNIEFTYEEKNKMVTKYLTQLFQRSFWYLDGHDILDNRMDIILHQIDKSNCDQILLNRILSERMLRIILKPIFLNLKILAIVDNYIVNIECLSFLNAENLEDLSVNSCFIIEAKSLNKTNWTRLRQLSLMNNQTRSLDLSRVKLHKRVKKLVFNTYDDEVQSNQDLLLLNRLQCRMIRMARICRKVMLNQQKVINVLERRFNGIQFDKYIEDSSD